ncbi:DddA-like double-stranded DNA deaminase toxin [Actinokineospora sp.]|uniref:DddA-like double-stranded DNA deaminase toxin n=1 Tax=Actinokineospora sp. TaxID=1872133 RepID=UPI0040384213
METLAAELNRVLALLRAARETIRTQLTDTDDQVALWTSLLHGSTAPEAAQIIAATHATHQSLIDTLTKIDAAGQHLLAYLTNLGVTTTRPGPPQPVPPAKVPPPPTRAQIDTLRAELPPLVRRKSGAKTHGRLVIDGTVRSVASGTSQLSRRAEEVLAGLGLKETPVTTSDVEVKTAVLMRDNGIRQATLVINNRVCWGPFGCETLVPILLPAGSTLTVHSLDPNGSKIQKTYTGGVQPPWGH